MYLRPLRHKALSFLGLSHKCVADACVRSWEISPAQEKLSAPAIYDPADLNYVQGSGSGTTIAAELRRLVCDVQHHAATKAYLLKQIDLVDGYVYSHRWRARLLPVRTPLWAAAPDVRVPHGTLACSWAGSVYFGHWIMDDLSLYLAAAELGAPFTLERRPYPHEPQYRELLDIPCNAIRRAHFDEMTLLEDVGQNDYKRQRYDSLRSRLRTHLRAPGSEYVFLRRGTSGEARTLVNSLEVESFLISQGFAVVDPESLMPLDIAERLLDARIVISVEGSQIAHALLAMSHGGMLCCIQPPWRFNNIYRGHTDCLNIRYAAIVGRACEGGFRVELDGLKRLLEKIDAALSVAA